MQYIANKEAYYKYLFQCCHCCNAGQSHTVRRFKYHLARYFGESSYGARRYADWNYNPFAKRFGYSSWRSMMQMLQIDALEVESLTKLGKLN